MAPASKSVCLTKTIGTNSRQTMTPLGDNFQKMFLKVLGITFP